MPRIRFEQPKPEKKQPGERNSRNRPAPTA